MAQATDIEVFLADVAAHDGFEALSDAKLPSLNDPAASVMIVEDTSVVAIGAITRHSRVDGTSHHAVETVVDPGMRFPAFEGAVLDATLALAGSGAAVSVWSRRSTLDCALSERGFTLSRELVYLVVDLPVHIESAVDVVDRGFAPPDTARIIEVNNLAFRDHREAGNLTPDEFESLCSASWFNNDGLRVVMVGSGIAGFCWTRVHANGDGEIFRIAVDPVLQGTGIGRSVLKAGFDHLWTEPVVRRGTLWVDTANERAMRLYESTGMTTERANREFERS